MNDSSTTLFHKHRIVFVVIFLAIVTVAVYAQMVTHDFVSLDDGLYITQNEIIQEGLTLKGIVWACTADAPYYWHPVTWWSHMLDCRLFGMNAGMHHMMNLLFHALNTILLFFLLQLMTGAFWRSAVVAALFALHPLHVESVAWACERKDVLSTFFFILSLVSYGAYVKQSRSVLYWLSLSVFVLALMSKPIIVTLPFVLILLDYWPLDHIAGRNAQGNGMGYPGRLLTTRFVVEKIPFLICAAGLSLITYVGQVKAGAVRSVEAIPLLVRVENAFVSYIRYMFKMFWPHNLAVYYPHPTNLPSWLENGPTVLAWQAAIAAMILVAICVIVIKKLRTHPYFAVGWFWYLGTLVPMIGIVQVGSHALADRFTYIPLVGLFIMLVWGATDLLAYRPYGKPILVLGTGFILAACMTVTFFQVRHWQDSVTLYKRAVTATSHNPLMRVNLGITLAGQGKHDEAARQFAEALKERPNYAKAHYHLGRILDEKGRSDDARRHYVKALETKQDYSKGFYNLGINDRMKAHYYLGELLVRQGEMKESAEHFRAILLNKPDHAGAHLSLGYVLSRRRILGDALFHYQEAMRLFPDYTAIASYNIACIHALQGRKNEAIRWLKKAIDAGFDDRELVMTDTDLVSIRELEEYRDLIDEWQD